MSEYCKGIICGINKDLKAKIMPSVHCLNNLCEECCSYLCDKCNIKKRKTKTKKKQSNIIYPKRKKISKKSSSVINSSSSKKSDNIIKKLKSDIISRDNQVKKLQYKGREKDRIINELKTSNLIAIKELESKNQEKDRIINELKASNLITIKDLESKNQEKDIMINELRNSTSSKDNAINELKNNNLRKDDTIKDLNANISSKDTIIINLKSSIADKDNGIEKLKNKPLHKVDNKSKQKKGNKKLSAKRTKMIELLQFENKNLKEKLTILEDRISDIKDCYKVVDGINKRLITINQSLNENINTTSKGLIAAINVEKTNIIKSKQKNSVKGSLKSKPYDNVFSNNMIPLYNPMFNGIVQHKKFVKIRPRPNIIDNRSKKKAKFENMQLENLLNTNVNQEISLVGNAKHGNGKKKKTGSNMSNVMQKNSEISKEIDISREGLDNVDQLVNDTINNGEFNFNGDMFPSLDFNLDEYAKDIPSLDLNSKNTELFNKNQEESDFWN